MTHEEARDMVEHASFAVVFTGSSLEREFGASCVDARFKMRWLVL